MGLDRIHRKRRLEPAYIDSRQDHSGIALAAVAITALFRKYGPQIKNGAQSAYGGIKQWIRHIQYPNGTLKESGISDKQLAYASDLTYEDNVDPNVIKESLGKKWIEDTSLSHDFPNGLQVHVFVNPSTKKMIIAFRGTEPDRWEDILIGDGSIALGNDTLNLQMRSARTYVQEEILSKKKYKSFAKAFTGHSLGGYLATDCAARNKIPAVTFNAPGKNILPNVNGSTLIGALAGPKGAAGVTAVTYVINMTDPNVQVDAVKELTGSYDELIRNYRFNDDVVGSLGYRLGETYDISKEGNVELDEGLDNKLNVKFWSGSHTISNFTTGYDSETKEKLDTPIPELYREDGNIAPR